MRKLRVVAVLVVVCGVVCGVVGMGIAPAGAGRSGTRDVTVTVPMTCVGATTETRTITVSATLPRQVRAGRAYTVTNLTTDVPNGGAVTLAAGNGHPAVFAAGSDGSSTIQLVAGRKAGRRIGLDVTRADYVLPGSIIGDPRPVLIPGVRVSCTPTAPVRLGSIKVVGHGGGHGPGTAGIDVTVGLDTTVLDQPFASNPSRVTATVPTKLRPGQTFTLADLQATVPLPFTAQFSIVVDGADPPAVTAGSVHTVTARPGETVDIRLVAVAYDVGVVASRPISSGHLASIPVTAR